MKVGKCIYCKSETSLNREHAFPQSLCQRNTPEWIIDNHLCEKCNSDLGKLDVVLSQRSPIGFIFDLIQRERGQKNKSVYASPYHKINSGVKPIRMLFPNPVYDDLIVLHEPGSMNHQLNYLGVITLQPQMILTQYRDGQTYRDIVEENKRKYDTPCFRRNENWYTPDEEDDVFCLFGNTHIFPPKTTQRYLANVDDFKSKYLTDDPHTRYSLRSISPEEGRGEQKFFDFFNQVQAETKTMIAEDKNLPMEVFRKPITVIMDNNAELLFHRAIAKLAFHCFLFHYPKYTGHETMFNSVKDFIYHGNGTPLKYVWAAKDDQMESMIYDTPRHQHFFRYFVKDDNIGCQIDLFTGLNYPPFSFGIVLAGDPDKIPFSPDLVRYFPFFVHPRSVLKKRIVSPSGVRSIQPSNLSGLLWL